MTYVAIWIISILSIGGVIIRPFNAPEALWAVGGAFLLISCKLILPSQGITGIIKGTDVYLFLAGMMLLAETAREEKLFDWLAAYATLISKGSPHRLFVLIYLVGIVVTALLSNDATAVVLTPAVAVAAKTAKIKNPLPYLLICAFIANAASFILPISNPANLVIYGNQMPSLLRWLCQYLLPSVFSIVVTFLMLRFTQRNVLKQPVAANIPVPMLSQGARAALWGIAATAIILLAASALNIQLGLPTAVTGMLTSLIVTIATKKSPVIVIKNVSWSILPLVAGLFVIVEALNSTGIIEHITSTLMRSATQSVAATTWCSGIAIAFLCNLMNNLPAGLIAGNVIQVAHVPELIKRSVLIGIDLGPNLSITGSLATILWMIALRREGLTVTAWAFFKLGAVVMTTALLFAIAALWL